MRILISVSDKSGLEGFAKSLTAMGHEIISTGGTYNFLKEHGINAIKIEEITHFPEMLGGRVKTLHPAVHAGILAKKASDLTKLGITAIDMVVVNLYPFSKFVEENEEDMIENIDIGGVALLRAAAKNYERVIVVSAPSQYDEVISLVQNNGFDYEKRRNYAMHAFAITASYDVLIYNTLWHRFRKDMPDTLLLTSPMKEKLRYGENPHQNGGYYSSTKAFIQHNGKKLSFNNLYDIDSAYSLVLEFEKPAAVVIKHANPCGAALGRDLKDALDRAWQGDPMSAYGSIVAFNREIDYETAVLLKNKFVEVVVSPGFGDDALELLKKKKKLRVIEMQNFNVEKREIRQLHFGYLAQEWDTKKLYEINVVSKRLPSEAEIRDLMFAWSIVKHVKSNAIVFAKDEMIVGTGAGQMSRVDSVKIAKMKAGDRAKGAVMASDAFFPFRDGIDVAHEAGISAVIQPGGSIRDKDVINAVNDYNMAMVISGYRVFRH